MDSSCFHVHKPLNFLTRHHGCFAIYVARHLPREKIFSHIMRITATNVRPVGHCSPMRKLWKPTLRRCTHGSRDCLVHKSCMKRRREWHEERSGNLKCAVSVGSSIELTTSWRSTWGNTQVKNLSNAQHVQRHSDLKLDWPSMRLSIQVIMSLLVTRVGKDSSANRIWLFTSVSTVIWNLTHAQHVDVTSRLNSPSWTIRTATWVWSHTFVRPVGGVLSQRACVSHTNAFTQEQITNSTHVPYATRCLWASHIWQHTCAYILVRSPSCVKCVAKASWHVSTCVYTPLCIQVRRVLCVSGVARHLQGAMPCAAIGVVILVNGHIVVTSVGRALLSFRHLLFISDCILVSVPTPVTYVTKPLCPARQWCHTERNTTLEESKLLM